jgi:ABC-type sugar transport system, periplasmic component
MGNSWTTQYEQAVRARLDRYKQLGIVSDYTYVAVNSDVTAQLNQLNTLLQDNYDVIMVDPVSPTSLTSFITEAKQKGVKVILGCTNAPVEGIPSFSSDYSVYGLSEAQYLMDQIGGKGNIAEIHGVPGDPNSALFQKYAKQIYDKYPDVKIIATGYGKWNDADAQTAMSTLIASYGDQINGIFAEDGMAYGIVNAYQNAGKPLVPMGGDYFNTFIQYWYHNEDKIHTTVTVNSPFALGTALADICVYEAAGYAPKQLEPNPLDESVSNWVPLEFPYVIFNKDEMTPSWMSQFPHTKAISIDDVAKQMADQPNTAAPELYFDDNYIASLFGVDKNPWLS